MNCLLGEGASRQRCAMRRGYAGRRATPACWCNGDVRRPRRTPVSMRGCQQCRDACGRRWSANMFDGLLPSHRRHHTSHRRIYRARAFVKCAPVRQWRRRRSNSPVVQPRKGFNELLNNRRALTLNHKQSVLPPSSTPPFIASPVKFCSISLGSRARTPAGTQRRVQI